MIKWNHFFLASQVKALVGLSTPKATGEVSCNIIVILFINRIIVNKTPTLSNSISALHSFYIRLLTDRIS